MPPHDDARRIGNGLRFGRVGARSQDVGDQRTRDRGIIHLAQHILQVTEPFAKRLRPPLRPKRREEVDRIAQLLESDPKRVPFLLVELGDALACLLQLPITLGEPFARERCRRQQRLATARRSLHPRSDHRRRRRLEHERAKTFRTQRRQQLIPRKRLPLTR
jgi:hypothetical protein